MASPQLEKGFLKLATGGIDNDLVLALASHNFSSCEYAILLVVIRKTYGFHKKDDWIAVSQFVSLTKRPERSIRWSIARLRENNVLFYFKHRGNKYSKVSLNKDFHSWKNYDTATHCRTNGSHGNPLPSPRQSIAPTKETITKETNYTT